MKLVSNKDSRLYEVSSDVLEDEIDGLSEIVTNLITLMENNRGIGIAAPQAGINKNLFILRVNKNIKVYINPKITECSEKTKLMEEGCISFPGLFMKVTRNMWIDVAYLNELGDSVEERLTGIASQAFQHELDHLKGITFDQRVSPFVYRRATEKRDKMVKKIMRRMKK